jgi:thiamine-monophosphate kinase
MDVSDGLAGDLTKLCAASGVSAAIHAPGIPLSRPAAALIANRTVGIDTLVTGGDDYEILCTVPEADFEAFAQDARKAGVQVTPIGAVIAGSAIPSFLDDRGRELPLKRRSWSHF